MELNHRPTGYESVALPLSYTGTRINLSSLILFLSNSNKPESNLDPNLRARLLKETKNPYRGLRRAVWIALFGSAALGLFIMLTNIIAGDTVSINDLAIQTSALVILGFLLFKDRNKDDVKDVSTGFECGIGCDRFANWEEGDQIEAFKLVTQRRKLTN